MILPFLPSFFFVELCSGLQHTRQTTQKRNLTALKSIFLTDREAGSVWDTKHSDVLSWSEPAHHQLRNSMINTCFSFTSVFNRTTSLFWPSGRHHCSYFTVLLLFITTTVEIPCFALHNFNYFQIIVSVLLIKVSNY